MLLKSCVLPRNLLPRGLFFFFFEIKKSKEKKKTILQLHEATGHLKILKLEKMMIYLNVLESVFCLKL